MKVDSTAVQNLFPNVNFVETPSPLSSLSPNLGSAWSVYPKQFSSMTMSVFFYVHFRYILASVRSVVLQVVALCATLYTWTKMKVEATVVQNLIPNVNFVVTSISLINSIPKLGVCMICISQTDQQHDVCLWFVMYMACPLHYNTLT